MGIFAMMALGALLAVVGFFLLFSATIGVLLFISNITPFVGLILFAVGMYILVNSGKNKKKD